MKTKIKRHSRSVISVILAVCMLISCMTVGIIATDAAKVQSESVGYGNSFSNIQNLRIYGDSFDGWTATNSDEWFFHDSGDMNKWYKDYYLACASDGTYGQFRLYAGYPNSAQDIRPNGDTWWIGYGTNTVCTDIYGGLNGNNAWTLRVPTTSGSGYFHVNFTFWGKYNENNNDHAKLEVNVEALDAITASLSAGDASISAGRSTTVTPSASGGSGSYNHAYTVRGANGTAYNSYINSSGVFSPPVDAPVQTYTITDTVTDANIAAVTQTATVNIEVTAASAYSYFVTSAGADDDTTGFTGVAWDPADPDGGMSADTSVSGYTHSKTFTDVPVGTYRFKITDGTWTNNWGDNGSINYTDAANTANQTKENNGNAKFDLTKASDVTIRFNSTSHAIKVETTDAAVGNKYYIVGQASDGTRGMFANVWANNWTTFNSADEITVSGGAGSKVYTDFAGTTGTYTYKVIKVGASGITQYFPETGDGQTVNVTSRTTRVTFAITTNEDGDILTATATPAEGSAAVWPPTDEAVTNVTNSSVTTSKYLLVSNNDNFAENGDNVKYAIALSKKYETTSNFYYWADLTGYLNIDTLHIMLSLGSAKNDAANLGLAAKVNDKNFILSGGSADNHDYYATNGTTKLFTAAGKERDGQFRRAEISSKDSSLNHLGVLIRTKKSSEANNWIEYSFFYTDGTSEAVTEIDTVDIYAKNGTLRDNTFNRFTNLADTDIVSITDPDGIVHTPNDWATAAASWATGIAEWDNNVSGYNSNYVKVTKVPVGSKIKLRTYLSGSTSGDQIYQSGKSFAETHYLKAYSFNGMTYQLHKASEAKTATTGYKFVSGDKYYEEEWTVEKVNTTNMKNGNTVEITPIYYLTDNSNTKTFYIDGYIGDLQTKWGTMLTVYPYYEGKSNKANAFGGYPGQPMLYWGGKYQMEIPLTVDGTASGAQVKGLTMHNGYWDLLHRALDTKCDDGHCQTYDYDDFYKLYKEKNADTIYFWFKYRDTEKHDNYNDGYEYTDYDFVTDTEGAADIGSSTTIDAIKAANGAEVVTDYYGRQVGLFGDLINDDDKSTYVGDSPALKGDELLIVSDGYKDTYVGEYGTMWAVYTQDSYNASTGAITAADKGKFTFLGYISSSMLYLNSINSVNQYTGGTDTSSGRMSWSEFKNTYNTLKSTYKNVPAIISYEKEIWNDSKDKAFRSDGKWFYSMGNDKITANIKIQYTSKTDATLMDETANWTDDSFSESVTGFAGEHNVGSTTGCSAYFTNTTPEYLVGKTKAENILVDNNKHFTFQAANGGAYEFVGWVRECGGEQNAIASTNGLGESNISANDTYIARFKPVSTGKLVISHNITQDATHKGNGTKYLKVQVYNGTTLKKEYVSTDGSDVDVSDFIKSTTRDYKIKVTLSTVPDEDCRVEARTCSPDTFATDAITDPQAGVTVTQTKEFLVSEVFDGTKSTVTAIRYLTALTKTQMTYNYAITYHYTSRFWGAQSYYVSGTVDDERYSAQYFTGTKSGARLTDEFIKNSTPYEKNFRQKINWNYTSSAVGDAAAMTKGCSSSEANVYDLTAEVWSANTVNDEVKAEFLLPYKYVSDTKSAAPLPVYTAANGTVTENTEYAFDEDTYESFTLTSQVGRLFQYDNTVPGVAQASDHASQYKLVEAAPYVLYQSYDKETDKIIPVDFHHKKVSSKRYYTGNSFTIKKNGVDVTYYLNAVPDGAPAGSQALTASNTETVNKPEKQGQDGYNGTTYDFAVQADDGRVYFFAYAMDNNDEPEKVDGQFVFNGQYVVYSENDVIDGIVQGDYVKKYFTRWDIFNSNGVKVASSYYRQFNYSGYENYTIKPIYTSDEPTAATFDENEGSDGIAATISYLGDSRNQWKGSSASDTTAGGDYSSVTKMNDATYAGDKLFADFAIAYNYNDQQLSTISSTSETIKIGMVIEKLDTVKTVNGKVVTDPNYYQGLAAYNQFNVEDMQNYILSKVATGHTYSGRPNSVDKTYDGGAKGSSYGVTHVAIGSNGNGFAGDKTSTLLFGEGTPMLDNKNRLQYFYTFTKSKNDFENLSENEGNSRPYDCVYRVSSYIYVKNGSKETVRVSAPIYITLYDTATRKGG